MKTPNFKDLPHAELERLRVMVDETSECIERGRRPWSRREDLNKALRLVTRLCAAISKAERAQQAKAAKGAKK